jgi:hypothetical protein
VSQAPLPADEDDGDFDVGRLRDWASYVLRAVGRNLLGVLLLAALVLAGTKFVVWAIPDLYYVEARLLAQRPDVNAILSSPSALSDPGAATRFVGQMVRRRDNLLALIGQTGLLQHWRATPPPMEQLEGRLNLRRPLDDEDLTEFLVGELEANLVASARDGVVTIAATWHDPDMAQRLVDAALQNFLETRHVNEMAILDESISLLEERLAEAQRGLDQAMSEVRSLPAPTRRAVREVRPLPAPDEASLELTRLRSTIAAKRRAEQDLVSFRDRKIAELQARLAEQKAVYSESHPVVANIRRSLEALAVDSPQLAALRQELHELEAEYVARGGTPANLDDRPLARPAAPTSAPAIIASMEGPTRDPSEDYARSRLATAIARYYSSVDRIEAVRLERDAARASIKYRYAVVRPPLRPRAPTNRGLKVKIWVAGALGGLLLGVLAAVAREMRRGRIVQRWQVEYGLGLAILAELPAKAALRDQRRSA